VRDEKGQKISKSLGNNIDPLDVIEDYGADALRMSLIVGVGPGSDSKLSYQKIGAYKKFANKIWNVTRFVLSSLPENFDYLQKPEMSEKDIKRLAQLETLCGEVTEDMSNYSLHLASEKLYHYIWHEFADIILEEAKPVLADGTSEEKKSIQWTLMHILRTSVKLLHPFMPFITEEIWQDIKRPEENLLLVEKWPVNNKLND
jgi:valyl-tRNA synthetase